MRGCVLRQIRCVALRGDIYIYRMRVASRNWKAKSAIGIVNRQQRSCAILGKCCGKVSNVEYTFTGNLLGDSGIIYRFPLIYREILGDRDVFPERICIKYALSANTYKDISCNPARETIMLLDRVHEIETKLLLHIK